MHSFLHHCPLVQTARWAFVSQTLVARGFEIQRKLRKFELQTVRMLVRGHISSIFISSIGGGSLVVNSLDKSYAGAPAEAAPGFLLYKPKKS